MCPIPGPPIMFYSFCVRFLFKRGLMICGFALIMHVVCDSRHYLYWRVILAKPRGWIFY